MWNELQNQLINSKYYYFHTDNGVLLCGDCLEVMKLLPDESIDLVLTDPPYNISQNKKIDRTRINSRSLKRTGKVKELNLNFGKWDFFESNREYFEFIYKVCNEFTPKTKESCSLYMWAPRSEISFIEYILVEVGWHVRSTVPQIFKVGYMSSTEFCIFGTRMKGRKHFWNINRGQRHSYWITSICQGKERTSHPTQKKLEIVEDMIINSSQESNIVLDCFLGSGTTAVACEKLNRKWIGIEISEEYCKIAKKRLTSMQQVLFYKE